MDNLSVSVDYIKAVNYSLCQNHIPICRYVEIRNDGAEDVEEVRFRVSGRYILDRESPMYGAIKSGKALKVSDFEIVPKADELFNLSERVASSFVLEVFVKGECACKAEFELDLMTFDQWLGTTILPQCLASFCMPNHPVVNNLVLKAAVKLKEITGSTAFVAYQDGNPHTVLKQAAAIFATLHEENIVYRSIPASYEAVGQRITLVDQILTTKLANCIELTLLMASVLEAVGIYSGVVIIKGHAFLAVWLDELCSQHAVLDDCSFIAKKCAEGIMEMTVIECTLLTQQNTSFESAQEVARQHLLNLDTFEMYIDIKRCRLEGIRPLPSRSKEGDGWKVDDVDGIDHESCDIKVSEHTKYDLDIAYDDAKETNKLDIWERKLLDFSLRNNFLNLSLRTRAIQFISFEVDHIEDYLQDGDEYCMMPMPDVELNLTRDEQLVRSGSAVALAPLVKNDISKDKVLHTYLKEEESQRVLTNIYRSSRVSIEETGANSLYLAIGLLRWYEKKNSPKSRFAPILLLPIEMVRKRGRYYIRKRDEDISLNITLFEYIRQSFGITVKGIDPLPTDEHGVNVSLIFAQIRDALKEQSKWDVEEECILGTFSFNKFLMWNDIHLNRGKLVENPVVASLVNGALTWTPKPIAVNLSEEDKTLTPDSLSLPVPVDSSQMAAVLEAGKGSTFILYGPPGTGKSQTITNLIANALYQGKRVLFVAEKMAALNVVQNRLEKIDLGPFCLELHSNKVAKRHILDQLDKALKALRIKEPDNVKELSDKLFERRNILIAYLDALHNDRGEDGLSIYECIREYEEFDNVNPLNVRLTGALALFKKDKLDAFREELYVHFPAVLHLVGQPNGHPLKELKINIDGLAHRDALLDLLNQGRRLSSAFGKVRSLLLGSFGESLPDSGTLLFKGLKLLGYLSAFPIHHPCIIDTAMDADRCMELEILCHEMEQRDEQYGRLVKDNRQEFLDEDVLPLLKSWSEIQGKWFLSRIFATRSFLGKLKFYNNAIGKDNVEAVLECILSYQKLRKRCSSKEQIVKDYTGRTLSTTELGVLLRRLPILKDRISEFATEAHIERNELVTRLKGVFNEDLSTKLQGAETLCDDWEGMLQRLSQLAEISWPERDFAKEVPPMFTRWIDNIAKVEKWCNWCDLRLRMLSIGLDTVVETTETNDVDPRELADRFLKGFYKSLAERKITSHANLIAFEGLLFDQQVNVYKDLTTEFQELSKKLLYSRLSTQIPQIYDDIAGSGELGLLLRNIANGARGMSIRQLLDSIPNLLPKLCPCMLMSPMSVAQYIDLDQDKFDLVVFDEASQMPTSEAVGAIARGQSLVVVGDPKQMPPTSFFSSNNIDEEDESIDDLESILQDCQALGIPSLQLNWHYRSRHESLIAFSNNEYYDGDLITFPSTDDQTTKVGFVKIDGVYEKGGKRCNRAEAQSIVKEVVRRLKDELLRQDSIGIIAFSSTQQTLIEDLLSDTIERDKQLTQLADSMYEPIFVKNLENVQGDERDVILFSIGYGPDANGKISMNFGPLNKVGGERRLNVAVSRARKEMIVYSTMTAGQINLNNTKSKGVEGLKHFLEYAEKQVLFEASRAGKAAGNTSIQRQIAKALVERGYEVKTEVGLSDFKIDVAIVDPRDRSNYILGILLDGDIYRNTQTTRDREIVQPTVLNLLNWNVVRVWSIDWFKQPDVVVQRIEERVAKIIEGQSNSAAVAVEQKQEDNQGINSFAITSDDVINDTPTTKAADYPDINYDYHEEVEGYIGMVIRNEQPIMYSLLCKRVAAFLDMGRVTSTTQFHVDAALARYHHECDRDNRVIALDADVLRRWDAYRPNTDANRRSIEEIPSVELATVVLEVAGQNLSIAEDSLTLIAAKRMGFARRGANVDVAFKQVLSRLICNGKLSECDGKITVN
ncbi:MAG: DUF4011 domain-containing protein [Bacteroidales bacterium]|nr:DUF4011 domain-containing protein [Candidatus Colimorpha onthohippi]